MKGSSPGLPPEGVLVMRQRSSWEAADSGVLLWRNCFVYFIPFFALPLWIAACAFRFLPGFFQPWSYLALWWLKPLFDRPVLHILSIRFFEPDSGIPRFFRGLGGAVFRGLPGDLLWRRFNPWRSSRMPLRLLERLRGGNLRRRKELLERGGLNFCFLITVLCLLLEGALIFGEVFCAGITIKQFRPDLDFSFNEFFAGLELFLFAAYCFNYILIESLYVCMGFGLYINSRIGIEGWDIQLLFQDFIRQKKASPPEKAAAVFPGGKTAVLCLVLFLFVPSPGRAETAEAPGGNGGGQRLEAGVLTGGRFLNFREAASPEPDVPLGDLKEILASDDFGGQRTVRGIRLKEQEKEKGGEAGAFDPASWLRAFHRFLSINRKVAFTLRLVLIFAAAAAAVFFLYHAFKRRRNSPAFPGEAPRFLPAASPPGGPGALLDYAGELYGQGKDREAWASCLAGTLAAYTASREVCFPPGATEYDCLALVRVSEKAPGAADRIAGLEALVRRWVGFAYAGNPPGEGDFEKSLGFGRSLLEYPAGKGGGRG